MAKATIEYRPDDGATIITSVETSNDYPDAAADAILRVVELYRMAVPDEAE